MTRGWMLVRRMVEYFTRRLKSGIGWSGEGLMNRGREGGAVSLPWVGGARRSGEHMMDRGRAVSLSWVGGARGSGEGMMDRGREGGAVSLPGKSRKLA